MKTIKVVLGVVIGLLMALNVQAKNISQKKLQELLKSDDRPLLIDVRTPSEYANGHIEGAINMPHKQLKGQLALLTDAKNKQIVLYCHSGTRANYAKKVLKKNGFKQLDHLAGDYKAWKKKGLPLIKMENASKSTKTPSNPCAI
jgi:phage shock protein E